MCFFVVTPLCNYIIEAVTPKKAWSRAMTHEIPLNDMFIDRDKLIERGYKTLRATTLENVYELK